MKWTLDRHSIGICRIDGMLYLESCVELCLKHIMIIVCIRAFGHPHMGRQDFFAETGGLRMNR